MRPDVAQAFDRMAAAARRDGIYLIVVSGFRSDAEQARLFAAHPDPKWVAPPGKSLHRLGTELDLGPASAYGWLASNARRFGFVKRYSWEPWHFGYVRNAGSASLGYVARTGDDRSAVPSFVPARFRGIIARAAQRWNVGAALLSAQLYAESGFNPHATSPAGAQGIAQFMPGTAAGYGLGNPFDPAAAIDAQAHPHARPAQALRLGAAGAGRLQRRLRRRRALHVHPALPGDPGLRGEDPRPAGRRRGHSAAEVRGTAGGMTVELVGSAG